MCLTIDKERTKEERTKEEPIIAYKLVKKNGESLFQDFEWPEEGEVISDRKSTSIPILATSIFEGLHFFEKGLSPCRGSCRHLYLYPCLCPCPCLNNGEGAYDITGHKLLKCLIKREDLVACGEWNRFKSLVATKCTVLGVVGNG